MFSSLAPVIWCHEERYQLDTWIFKNIWLCLKGRLKGIINHFPNPKKLKFNFGRDTSYKLLRGWLIAWLCVIKLLMIPSNHIACFPSWSVPKLVFHITQWYTDCHYSWVPSALLLVSFFSCLLPFPELRHFPESWISA